jgi:hypothetical protein
MGLDIFLFFTRGSLLGRTAQLLSTLKLFLVFSRASHKLLPGLAKPKIRNWDVSPSISCGRCRSLDRWDGAAQVRSQGFR